MVIDDEPASVRTVERTLAEEASVITTTSATHGLELLAAQPVDLMIVDQRMPEMSGTELLARSAVERPEVIRILLTGYTGIDTLVDAINQGHVYYYLTKPWEPQELRLVVRRGLERYDAEAERQRLLTELAQACTRIQREADQKGRLLALATHELGTPLHVLANALELMDETTLPAAARAWVDTARRSAAWLARGLQQMATGGRWRARSLQLHCRPIDLAALLADLRLAFHAAAATRAIALRLEVASRLPPLVADPLWLKRGLANLISNAVRFTPDGGAITVTATATPAAVEITVADSGIGIDPSLLDEVFEPFSAACGDVSLHSSGQHEFGSRGLGLGLAITKAIVEEHAGSITVRSHPGAGTQFSVTLPLAIGGMA